MFDLADFILFFGIVSSFNSSSKLFKSFTSISLDILLLPLEFLFLSFINSSIPMPKLDDLDPRISPLSTELFIFIVLSESKLLISIISGSLIMN